MSHYDYVVLFPTNAINKGNPKLRAFVVTDEEHAADIVTWLNTNGTQASVVTLDKYHQKLANYNERVAAAS